MTIDPWKKRSIEQFKNIFCLKKERKLKFVFPAEKNYECYVTRKKIEDFGTRILRQGNVNDAFACCNELMLLTLLPSPMLTDHVIADTVLSKHSCN